MLDHAVRRCHHRPVHGVRETIELRPVVLQDGELVLRPWQAGDADVRVRAGRDPEIRQWTSVPRDVDHDAALEWIAWSQLAIATGEALHLALTVDDRCVGSIGLIDVHQDHRRAEIGYWLLPEARGRGLAPRALRLLTAWSLGELPLARLDLYTNTDNDASMAVALRCGFSREALLRAWHSGPDGQEDLVLFGLVRGDAA